LFLVNTFSGKEVVFGMELSTTIFKLFLLEQTDVPFDIVDVRNLLEKV
jgi:hypothetical protein